MAELQSVFERLKGILKQYEDELSVVSDDPEYYYLNTRQVDKKNRPVFFGMVKMIKNKVSYHLMPVYTHPGLLDEVSDDLKARMQGKSCFNFKSADERLITELEELTEQGYRVYKKDSLI
jgi:hypothetical protein